MTATDRKAFMKLLPQLEKQAANSEELARGDELNDHEKVLELQIAALEWTLVAVIKAIVKE